MTDGSTITNVGTKANVINTVDGILIPAEKTDANGEIVKTAVGNYLVNTIDGTLEITPAELTITAIDQTKTYNAAAQGENNATYTTSLDTKVTVAGLQGTDALTSITLNGRETNVGEYANRIVPSAAAISEATSNYTISYKAGKLTINPKAITIKADDKSMTYGEADPTLTATTTGLEGNDYIATTQTRAEGNNIGDYRITATVNAGQDIIRNYTIETLPGTLTINPRPVTVTAADKAKVYSEADPALTATVTGLAAGEGTNLISYTLSRATGEDVGEYAINPTGDAAQGNYTVTYVPGTLTIVAEDGIVVTITANNGSYKYDGNEKDLSGYSVAISNPLYTEADFTFTGSSDLKATNAGTYRTDMKASDFVNTNDNFEKVVFVVNNGELDITPREITLTSGSAEKVFDGTALTNDTITFSGDGFVEGEGVNTTVTGRQTTEGESENTFTYAMANGTAAGNYDITTVYGTLKVTEAEGEVVQYHKLTITYQYEDGTVIKTYTNNYRNGDTYSVTSDKLPGYEADVATVRGTMGNFDLNYTVTYYIADYTLTVKYVSLGDATQVANPVTMQLKAGDNYTVFTPKVEGYTALRDKVTGTMPSANRTITVFMVPEGSEGALGGNLGGSTGNGGGYNAVEIDDFGTPLGIADSILGGGEIIE